MKIRTEIHKCVGHARCAAVAPDIFELNDDGFNEIAERDVDEALRTQALRGMRACPERIISIDDAND